MLVDDVSIGIQRFGRSGSHSILSGDCYLMLGGIRPEVTLATTQLAGIQQPFVGCIADLTINNE